MRKIILLLLIFISCAVHAQTISGTGTANYIPKYRSVNVVGNSLIYDNGTNVSIGTTSPAAKLQLIGSTGSDVFSVTESGGTEGHLLIGTSSAYIGYGSSANRLTIQSLAATFAHGTQLSVTSPNLTLGTSTATTAIKGTTLNFATDVTNTTANMGNNSSDLFNFNGTIRYSVSPSNGYVLTSDGSGNASWAAPAGGSLTVGTTVISSGTSGRVLYNNAGVLGEMTTTGSGTVLALATSPTLVTPLLGTPTSGTLTNCTGLPISTGVSGLGTGVADFLGTPSSANLATAVTGETGSGALVFGTSPTLVTPAIGTPSSGVATNLTGLPLTSGVTGVLPEANGGTNQSTWTTGDLMYASASNTLSKLNSGGTAGMYLRNGGASTAPLWSTLILPNSITANNIVYGSATNTYGSSTNFTYDGSIMSIKTNTSQTNNFVGTNNIYCNSTGTPAAGLGGSVQFYAESSTTDDREQGEIGFQWGVVTDATRSAECVIKPRHTAGITANILRIGGEGAANSFSSLQTYSGGVQSTQYLCTGTTVRGIVRVNSSNTNMILGTQTANYALVLQSGNGATAMHIDGNQNVGIGTTSPTSFLHIGAGTTSKAQLRFTAGVAPSSPNDGDLWYVDTNDRLQFRQNATTVDVLGASAVNSVSPTAPNRTITVVIDGVTYYIHAKTTND